MLLVNIEYIPGKEIEALGMVKGTVVQSKNFGKDFMAGMKTLVGGEITGYTEMLNEARQIAVKPRALAPHELHERVATERVGRPCLRSGARYAHDSHTSASASTPPAAPGASATMRGVGAAHLAAQRAAVGTTSMFFAFVMAASTTGCDAPCSMRSCRVMAPK